MTDLSIDTELLRIIQATHHDPFAVLGRHPDGSGEIVRAFIPGAAAVTIAEGGLPMERVGDSDLFQWRGPAGSVPERYRLVWRDETRREHIAHDPYAFPPQLSDYDLHLFGEGNHWHAWRFLGSRVHEVDGVPGVLFSVWAPNAARVSVVGDFNQWDGRRHPMRVRGGIGVWELFIPGLDAGAFYKYEIRNRDSGAILLKSDPYGRQFELRPATATIVTAESDYPWDDGAWLEERRRRDWQHAPLSVYEVHLGSWARGMEGDFLGYRELAVQLVAYVKELGFSHIELLPITEHPYDPSWGYQSTGYYAPTSRFGTPDDFRWFVDHCHRNGIGVILDWVPAHFPKDAHGLARFDGSALYEHEDPRLGEHLDWSTLIYNFGRNEVKNFLLSNALYWLEEFHLDGLRVDAVASMLYLDYSRTDWVPNRYGGRENLEAIGFLRQLNTVVHQAQPGILMFAEESTAWPQVSRPVHLGGLGFDMKWNMGWMNDTLEYFSQDPVHRKYHHDRLTFSMLYAFTENFVLPFSHDEVVHGKQSMLNKMPGDEWQRFANLRLIYSYQFLHPGKKLLFMGCEFGQGLEWDSARTLDWYVLDYPLHQGVRQLVKDLNGLYHNAPALYRHEFDWEGIEWIDCHDADQSVLSFLRKDGDDFLVVVLNFTPVPRHGYRIGVPAAGLYRERLNSDSAYYGGSNLGNGAGPLAAEPTPWMGRPHSLALTLPPLAAIVLERVPGADA
ncbi:1,4-alpha-glucan branching protein GlgB [Thioalbus denitrificans]|uniref:1,4-alpha-glucan branching enzyme GlgB n=1 Tax=Thioalbus denitrificans TaxID=547122 RepID=A0A369BTJ8_9GAMM|nr:1,4-alpha-glucan branching protein GlgB [Thioalbus denitrificans]RCX24969.1 1,4-alpha-glucan branching enzyme [Thioalbus denitrificans]